jgi:nicotinamidase-related amidase
MLPLSPNPRSALLIIDMQGFFFRLPERRVGLEDTVANINRLIRAFDETSQPVVHVISAYKTDGSDWDLKMKASGEAELIEGSAEAAILPDIKVLPRHQILTKTRYSAFFKTDLAGTLHEQRVERVVVAGAYTHYCVNATMFDAYCHDFIPCLISDAVLSHLPDESKVMVARMHRNGYHVMSTDELLVQLQGNVPVSG